MLRLQYNNQFLTLLPGSAIEMERNSPLFLADNVLAEYTLPVTIVYDEANARLLGDVFFEYGIKNKFKIPVNIFDNETYRFKSTLVVDKNLTNRHQPGKGNVQGYLLTGISDFFNPIKDKKLSDLELGGTRSFPFTTWDPWDASNGFWQHVHATWTGAFDYVFSPIRNESWIEDDGFTGWMNMLGRGLLDSGITETAGQLIPYSWPVPQPRLKNMLQLIFEELGWQIDTTGLNDVFWEKLLVLNVNPVKTTYQTGEVDGIPLIGVLNVIKIQLRKCVSPEVTISEFILSHCKRYGWAPIFDSDTRTCYLIALKEVGNGKVKDFTPYAGPISTTDFSADTKKFSFKNSFTGNDGAVSTPDFTNYTIAQPVFKKANLPTPSAEYDNSVIYSFYENAWFKCVFDAIVNNRVWEKFADNIYDEDVKNNTDTVETNCTTLPTVVTYYRRSATGVEYYGLFARCMQPRNKEWGIRNLIYHGMVSEVKADGTVGDNIYPYAGSTVVQPNGTVANGWSNVFKHKNGQTDYGLIAYWFTNWLNINRVNTPVEKKLYLPLHELENLEWDDVINILNQPFLIQKYIDPIPYRGFIQATLLPLLLNDTELVATTPDAYGNTIYLRFGWEDEQDAADIYLYGMLLWTFVRRAKPIIRCYADAAGTVPATAYGLKVFLTLEYSDSETGVYTAFSDYSTIISGSVYNISQDELHNETNPSAPWAATSNGLYEKSYKDADGINSLFFRWVIKASADYKAI
ncbi:MAG: hypothetical protein M0Q26_05900 [Chitinophagaceae bacterium]|nr:hypothetical protein [Chitinophagaceae bacterium]MDP1763416.1 hypothetical protein [Sediminibacterium sp.]